MTTAAPTPPAVTGRGAWSVRGGTTPNYELVPRPHLGELYVTGKNRDPDHTAVWYGVKAIQAALNRRNTPPPKGSKPVLPLGVDGWFGAGTAEAVRQFKVANGRPNSHKVGSITARVLFLPDYVAAATKAGLPVEILCGFCFKESTHDPGAVGFLTPGDKGLCQINTVTHKIPDAQAFDVQWALTWTATRTVDAGRAYERLPTPRLIDKLTYQIAQHNWPVGANAWAKSGIAPVNRVNNMSLADYVASVRSGCE